MEYLYVVRVGEAEPLATFSTLLLRGYPRNNHKLWNAEEVVALIETFPYVKGYQWA